MASTIKKKQIVVRILYIFIQEVINCIIARVMLVNSKTNPLHYKLKVVRTSKMDGMLYHIADTYKITKNTNRFTFKYLYNLAIVVIISKNLQPNPDWEKATFSVIYHTAFCYALLVMRYYLHHGKTDSNSGGCRYVI